MKSIGFVSKPGEQVDMVIDTFTSSSQSYYSENVAHSCLFHQQKSKGQKVDNYKYSTWSIIQYRYGLFPSKIYHVSIDDVTCDVMPGSLRTYHSNINCCFARQFAHASRWSGHVLLKLPPRYTGYVVSHRVVQQFI